MHAATLATAVLLALATPPLPAGHVEDRAALLSADARAALDGKLAAYEQATGHPIVVWIGTSLEGAALDAWATQTFAAWQLGRKGHDDGLALFVFRDDRRIAIEVGYGLEERVPDAIAARIIREVMAPKLAANDRDGAVTAGVDAILTAIEGAAWHPPPAPPADRGWDIGFGIVVAVLAILLFAKYPRLATWLFWALLSGGRDGGHARGGGGGRSGGGGARGGW